ncbi:hypothetical protein [Pseudobacillus badius]|uniref:hypothetical protein n=1 Tax=Bacillus badius TaxID=1455 RepID=UPI0024A163BA|nr:hypothetical protein [Bacillus badius]GLY11358.1 hypothetical protein Bbad01_25740 [Bacillus badius]
MKVTGTVTIRYEVNVEVDDISQEAMSLYESDTLIAKAIDKKLPVGFWVEDDIRVQKTEKNNLQTID